MEVLNEKVLVLNKNFFVLCVIRVKAAMRLVFGEKAVIMDNWYNGYTADAWRESQDPTNKRVIRTPKKAFVVPEVIRLIEYDQVYSRPINLTRQNIFLRDGHECQYCGVSDQLTIDHVIPKSRADDFKMTTKEINSWENMVTCCQPCNGLKDNMTPEEIGYILRNPPTRPRYTILGYEQRHIKEAWKPYLGDKK